MSTTDPANDFLSTYTGPQNGDVDVISSDVVFHPAANTLTFSATFNAPVNTTPGALYVWGLDRGAGAELLMGGTPPIGGGIVFDSVFVAIPGNGAGLVNLFDGSAGTTLPGVVQVNGNSVVATVSAALFPSKGFATSDYLWNLWPRVGSDSANNAQISDFAPDNTVLQVTLPEPSALALAALGLAALVAARRRS
ncbi:MAG TPA: PEP-CTERM sorting domain-containing protein [Myxococcota bacterium]|nr:PEP-CTERM sorting domain-containing protein [Myxococcota bacterium]